MKALVVIPAYNESETILGTVKDVVSAGYDYVVVNDGSSDETLVICKENGINVLNLRNNLGIGGAVQAGHKYAFENGYDVDVQFDGDGQHDAGYIATLLERIDSGADLVIGSRFIDKNADGFKSSFLRRVGIKWLCACIKLTTGKKVTDPTSGFRATANKALKLFVDEYPTDYPEPESIVTAIKHGLKVEECQVLMHERQGGSSSIKPLSSIYYMLKVSIAILIKGVFDRGNK